MLKSLGTEGKYGSRLHGKKLEVIGQRHMLYTRGGRGYVKGLNRIRFKDDMIMQDW